MNKIPQIELTPILFLSKKHSIYNLNYLYKGNEYVVLSKNISIKYFT